MRCKLITAAKLAEMFQHSPYEIKQTRDPLNLAFFQCKHNKNCEGAKNVVIIYGGGGLKRFLDGGILHTLMLRGMTHSLSRVPPFPVISGNPEMSCVCHFFCKDQFMRTCTYMRGPRQGHI